MKSVIFIVFVIAYFCNNAESAKILVVYPFFGRSHYILGNGIAKGLVQAGHDVTMISPFEEKNPPKNGTWTDVVLTGLYEEAQKGQDMNMFEMSGMNPVLMLTFMSQMSKNMVTEPALAHPNFQKFLQTKQKFDVVIVEQFVMDAFKALGPYFDAPVIMVSSMGPTSLVNHLVGNPAPYSYISNIFLSYPSHMTLCQRIKNTLFSLFEIFLREVFVYPGQAELVKKYIPKPINFNDFMYNSSLVLLNTHISSAPPAPIVPSMIEVGGYHVFPPKPLPKDLQDFLDSAKDGAIYFSMGSNLKSAEMPEEQRKVLMKVFASLKQKVLWKFEDDNLPGKPSNVKISKWLPQQSILAHPNVRLFITHGGLLSTTETIYHGVPVLAFPIYGDQDLNAGQMEANGIGKKMDFFTLTENNLKAALNELLNNPKYRDNAKLRSKLFHDREIKPMDRLVYWVEYVIRHRGAPHLRVAALDIAWYQYLLLDVIAVILGGIVLFVVLTKFLVKKLCCRKSQKPAKKQKTN